MEFVIVISTEIDSSDGDGSHRRTHTTLLQDLAYSTHSL